jgi:hypothetical protein
LTIAATNTTFQINHEFPIWSTKTRMISSIVMHLLLKVLDKFYPICLCCYLRVLNSMISF